ncbi:MAG: HAMP domain-containing histidine kinase [Thaumarchaeota archaeon]|nr:HAMP domain-containing histidine kinase [Nitrososphaerota archaeon]
MSDISPFFFMKEFSNEELTRILISKIKELKTAKEKSDDLNTKLQDNMAKLEEMQEEATRQRDYLQAEVERKAHEILRSERLSAIGNLAARVAHDLRNPLSVIQSTSKILRLKLGEYLDEKSSEQWARLDRAVYRMSHQLEDVMDYVRMSPLKKKDYSLCVILQDVVERVVVPENVTIRLPQNDRTVFCDPEKLEIVFVNLVMNAVQAMESKEGTVSIGIFDDPKEQNNALIKVSDTGIGISEEMIDKIFEPLFTTKQVGTGLGLSSCKNIIEQHGGDISVSSIPGKGTTFTIKIPKKSEWNNIPSQSNLAETKTV